MAPAPSTDFFPYCARLSPLRPTVPRRKPAWTDRVLHMAAGAVTVKQSSYASHPTITFSDHRPVSAEFELEVRCLRLLTAFRWVFPPHISGPIGPLRPPRRRDDVDQEGSPGTRVLIIFLFRSQLLMSQNTRRSCSVSGAEYRVSNILMSGHVSGSLPPTWIFRLSRAFCIAQDRAFG